MGQVAVMQVGIVKQQNGYTMNRLVVEGTLTAAKDSPCIGLDVRSYVK